MSSQITLRALPTDDTTSVERAEQIATDLNEQLDSDTLVQLRKALEQPARCYEFASIQVDEYIQSHHDMLTEQGLDPNDPNVREAFETAISDAAENAGNSTIPDALEEMVFDKVLERLQEKFGDKLEM